MAWWTVGYHSTLSTPEELPGHFIAYMRPGLFGGLLHKLQLFLSPILGKVSAMLGSCLWTCLLRRESNSFPCTWKAFDCEL